MFDENSILAKYFARPMWLKSCTQGHLCNNPESAIKNKMSFEINNINSQQLICDIFGTRYPLILKVLEDLSMYPFEFDNYQELINGYNATNNSNMYFKYMTGLDPNLFLNHGERLFFLTRGYGKPHKYACVKEYERRKILCDPKVPGTAFSVFADLFSDLSENVLNNPDIIREKLYGYDLMSIPIYHMNAFLLICNEGIPKSLKMLGIYSEDIEYLIDKDFYITNCTQIKLYGTVIKDRKWYYEEIRGKSIEFIKDYLNTLSDDEILNITVPITLNLKSESIKFKQKKTNFLNRRDILEKSLKFLTDQKHIILQNYVIFGYLAGNLKVYTQDEFLWQIQNFGSLIDKNGNLITIAEAQELNEFLKSDILTSVITKTIAMELINNQKLQSTSVFNAKSELIIYGFRRCNGQIVEPRIGIPTTFKFNDEPLQQFPYLYNDSIEYYQKQNLLM